MQPHGDLGQAALSTGGGVALVFIVVLALGIVTMMVIYLASAVVVLDRFARVARRRSSRVAAGGVVAVTAGWLAVRVMHPELTQAPLGEWGRSFASLLGLASCATVVSMWLVHFSITRMDGVRLSGSVGLVVALGAAFAAAGTGIALIPASCIFPPLLVYAVGVIRRRRMGLERISPIQAFSGRVAALLGIATSLVLLPDPFVQYLGIAGRGLLSGFAVVVLLGLLPHAVAGIVDMRGTAEWFIASRYLVARRRQVFISAITAICVIGIAVGVWLIIVVLSVMNGFEQTWRDEILGDRAHFNVLRTDGPITDWESVLERTRAVPGVVAASPYLDADAMVRGRGGEIYSVRLRGIDPIAVGEVTRLRDDITAGSLDALRSGDPEFEGASVGDEENTLPRIVIGSQLASSLAVGIGDRLLVVSPFGGPPTPLGPAPRVTRFEVVGVVGSSFYQYEEVYAYVSIGTAQTFKRSGPVIDGIEVVTTDFYRSQLVGGDVAEALGAPFYTRDWKEYFPAFFQALKTERVMMGFLLAMIMVVAAFVIVATLIMMIMEKSSDIAILKAMGAEDSFIERIFAMEGTLIGLLGTGIGVLAGLAVTHRLRFIQDGIEAMTGVDALPSSVYQLSSLPSRVDPVQVAVVVVLAMILSLGATLLPSRQGARIDPAEGLRHE